jgi:uncharacterized membrane protein YeaQ/YmgE (transglycosylase-associated protein family)
MRRIARPETNKRRNVGILTWNVLGLIVGVIAKLIMPGDDPRGFTITTLLGIAGVLVGGSSPRP